MATARLEQRIDALDEDRLRLALAGLMDGDDAQDRAESTTLPLLNYLRAAPALLELVTLWADDSPPRRQFARQVAQARRHLLQPDDPTGGDRDVLTRLVADCFLIGSLAVRFAAAGMPYGAVDRLDLFNRFAASLLGAERVGELEAILADARAAPPADPRLLGVWHHKVFHDAGDLTHVHITSRLFGADGRYVEGDQSFVGMVHRAASGEEVARTDTSRASPALRGDWTLSGSVLRLEADSGTVTEADAEIHADSILLTAAGADPQLWTRR